MKAATWNVLAASALFALAGWLGVSNTALGQAGQPEKAAAKADDKTTAQTPTEDILIFRNGNVRNGTILSETPTSVKFKGVVSGIDYTTDYPKSDILEIKHGVKAAAGAGTPDPKTTPVPAAKAPAVTDDGIAKKNVYWVDLKGVFGEDISQTPIRQAL